MELECGFEGRQCFVIGLWLPSCEGADGVNAAEQSPTYQVKQEYLLD